jgi:hypothetical protein
MKKILFSVAILAANLSTQAQTTVIDFESLPLSGSETYYNGADLAGFFQVDDVKFENYYNAEFAYWGGFAYSNVTDNTTAGFGNQYSAYPGSGANNSENYGVYTTSGMIEFTNLTHLQSIKISNATYAALSMLNGDNFAKKFGGATGNDPDFFKVWIVAYDTEMLAIDSVEYYLADYRFADNTQDYIVDSWETIFFDIPVPVRYLTFKFESSDVGEWGMNTPAYVVIDDLGLNTIVGLDATFKSNLTIYPNPTKEYFKIADFTGSVSIFNNVGQLVFSGDVSENQEVSISGLLAGTYHVSLRNSEGLQVNTTLIKL